MSPAAGGAAPTQSAVSATVTPAIAAPEPDRAPPPPPPTASRRDLPGQPEGADPGNAAARKTAWNVPAPPPAAAAPGGIMGGAASWPALAESARAWPKSASSDSLRSLSDGSAPSAPEDLIVSSLLPHPVANPIPTGSNPTSTSPPPNAAAAASSQQNGSTNQPNPVRRSGGNGGNNGGGSGGNGSSGGRSSGNSSSGDGNGGSGGDGNWNNGGLGSGGGCNSSNGGGGSNLNDSVRNLNSGVHGSGGGGSGSDNNTGRSALGNNSWNSNGRGGGGGSNNNGTGSGDGSNRSTGGGSNHWNNNGRSGSSNGFGARGSYRNRRDHERGGNFSPRNYPRLSPGPHHQQQLGVYQPGPFHRGPPPPPPAHFMVPQHFVPYVPPFPYPADVQTYPLYLPPVEQFQNMHLVRQPAQPFWVHTEPQNLQESIRQQIEFYFSTENLCHDTFLRERMNDQGWVPIELILGFNRMRPFTDVVDTNYILDAIRGSEILEVQGNNVRRRNNWAIWLLH